MTRKLFFISLFFTLAVCIQALETEDTIEKEERLPTFPINISKFQIQAQYYGLPLAVKFGYFYRKSNMSIFPNLGFSLFRDENISINASTGITLQKSFFSWQLDGLYDIIPFTMNKEAKDQMFYAVNIFSFNIHGAKLSAITRAGNKRRFLSSNELSVANFEFSQGIHLDYFLIDLGYFKSTLSFNFAVDWVPKTNFLDYRIKFDFPNTFNLYYVDIAFMYSFYNSASLNNESLKAKENYIIEKKQSLITGRDSFKSEIGYSQLHLFGMEFRWYPTRIHDKGNKFSDVSKPYNLVAKTNGFFVSLFADSGFAITAQSKYNFIGEYGLGFGYTLFDCVPFTFQVGINQNATPVFFLGVVSRMTHPL
ncbi:MAG: hypothetical protein ACTTJ6_04055 [Treponema sp.]